MTLSLSIIKDFISDIYPKNSQFLKPQNVLQLLPISIYFSSEIKQQYNDQLYDKRDAFDAFGFHIVIVDFPFMSSNIPSTPAYGVYGGWLICVGCVGRSGSEWVAWVGVGCVGRSGLSGSKVKPHFHASLKFSDPLRPTPTHSDPLQPTPTHSDPLRPTWFS